MTEEQKRQLIKVRGSRPSFARPVFIVCSDCRDHCQAIAVEVAEEFLGKHDGHRTWVQPPRWSRASPGR